MGIVLGVVAGLIARHFLVKPQQTAVVVAPAGPLTPPPVVNSGGGTQAAAEKFPNPAYRETDAVYVKGFATWGHRLIVQLSDGTRWDNRDPKLQRVEKMYVIYDGKKYPVRVNYSVASSRPSSLPPGGAVPAWGGPPGGVVMPKTYSGAGNPVAETKTTYEAIGEAVIPHNQMPGHMSKMGFSGPSVR